VDKKHWDDFFYYGIHQMGFAGFSDIYRNRNKLLSEISASRRNNILANKPSKLEWNRVSDWWDYFANRFYKIYNEHKSSSITPMIASVIPLPDIDINTIKEKIVNNKEIVAGVVVVGVVGIYFIYKNIKKRRKNKK
jgi:hypothetical protein